MASGSQPSIPSSIAGTHLPRRPSVWMTCSLSRSYHLDNMTDASIRTNCPCLFLFFFFFWDGVLFCCQAGVQWSNLSLLQTSTLRLKWVSCLGLLSSWDYRYVPPTQLIFVFFSRDGVSPYWSGWSRSLDLVICPSRPLGLKAWATTTGKGRFLSTFRKERNEPHKPQAQEATHTILY